MEARKTLGAVIKNNITQVMLVIETIIIFGVFQILTDGTFLTARNLTNIMMQGCVYSIIGIGIVFVRSAAIWTCPRLGSGLPGPRLAR